MNYSERIHNRLAALRTDNSARQACTDIAGEADAEIAALREALAYMVANIGQPRALETRDGFAKAEALMRGELVLPNVAIEPAPRVGSAD